MQLYKNDFDIDLPYRVISIETQFGFKYKIKQPLKLWIFGLSARYYDVCEWSLIRKYKTVKYFKDKVEVDAFVLSEQNKKKIINKEIVVFDSLHSS